MVCGNKGSRSRTHLGKRHHFAASKERRRILQQRLNLLPHSSHQIPAKLLLLLAIDRFHNRIHHRIYLCEPRIYKKRYPRTTKGTGGRLVALGPEIGIGIGVREEGGDDGGLGDYLVL